MPMIALPLVARSYEMTSRAADGRRLLNFYAETMPEGARSPFILKPTPGLVAFLDIGFGPIRAMATRPGMLYVASGREFFRWNADGSGSQFLGDMGLVIEDPAPINRGVSIAIGDRAAVVCNPPRAFIVAHGSNFIRQLTTVDDNFPAGGASSVSYIDGYFAFTSFDGSYFFVSKVADNADFDDLDFASFERRPDTMQWGVAHNGELWLFGLNAMGVWYNAGVADFPFRERAGSIQDRGVASPRTIASMDRSLVFLGNDRIVYRTEGYALRRISDHALEDDLARGSPLDFFSGFSFTFEGHQCYALRTTTFGGKTWVYDASTGVWHERSSAADGSGPWVAGGAAQLGKDQFFGSAVNGKIYLMDANFGSDDGVALRREAVLPPLLQQGARAFMSRLEVEMEVGGSEPQAITLDWTDDGGATWSAGRVISTDARGARTRVAANRLGSFRQRNLRLRAGGRATIYSVDAAVEAGAH